MYAFNLRDPIPTFPLPLRPEDEEPVVDLSALLQELYDRAGYDLVVDYTADPVPPLEGEDAAWPTNCCGRRDCGEIFSAADGTCVTADASFC